MGCGFLALPSSFASAGVVLGTMTLIIVTILMTGTGFFEAEIMCRAEVVTKARLQPNKYDQLKRNLENEMEIRRHAYPMVELCEIFGSRRLKSFYTLAIVLFLFSAAWGYASVFANAFAAYFPVPFLNDFKTCRDESECFGLYSFYILVFAIITVPMSLLEVKEQEAFQIFMTFMRFLLVVVMVGTTMHGTLTGKEVFGATADESLDHLSLFRFGGLWTTIPTCIFAQCLNTNIALVVHDMEDKKKLGTALGWGMVITCLFYGLIACSVVLYFGAAVASSCNVNWESYHGGYPEGRPWWASAISLFVVAFPAIDVMSIYPLNTLIMSQNLMAFVYHDRIDKAEEDDVIKLVFRLLCAVPPILCAVAISNLLSIMDYAGATVCILSFIIPPYLNRLSIARVKDEFETTNASTRFSSCFSHKIPSNILIFTGWVLFVGIIIMTAKTG